MLASGVLVLPGLMPDGILQDSSKLQQVCDVTVQIKEEMKPLAKAEWDVVKAYVVFPSMQKLSIPFHSLLSGWGWQR